MGTLNRLLWVIQV